MVAPTNTSPRLIVSFDVGTTQSAVVVAYLTPGRAPFVSGVDRWPGQEDAIHEAKVPTAVLYDEEGTLVACGAEALSLDMTSRPAWSQPEHFKMLLHPGGNTSSQDDRRNPRAVPLSKVYADYLGYLLGHTRSYLTDAFGYDLWLELEDRVEIVLSHPNSWSEREQKFLQKAAVQARLITKAAAAQRLHFVEEAEAAACYAIGMNPILASKMEFGAKFVICDAGGSTVDISAYRVNSRPGEDVDVEELEHPSCLDAGGIHVDKEFVMHLYEQLYTEDDFREEDQDYLHGIVDDGRQDFQRFGKRKFSSPKDHLLVRVGGRSMNYPEIHVTRGMMNIESPTADNFFKPFVEQAIETIGGLVERHGIKIIIITGGFSESPYFKLMVETRLTMADKTLILANHPQSKAVAMGAMKLIAGGRGSMTVQRKRRRWPMWLTNFRQGVKEFLGNQK